MLRIHQLFFLNVLGLFLAALVVASGISFIALKSMIIQNGEEDLIRALELVAPQVLVSPSPDYLAHQVARTSGLRMSIIDEHGVVIAESDRDRRTMENHLQRPEIMQAMSERYGVSIRYSNTLHRDFIYLAKALKTPKGILYIRLAMGLEGVMQHFYALWWKLLGVFVLLTFVATMIAYKMAHKARYDIVQITQYLDEISNKNYKAILKPKYFHEFLHISILLKNLVKKLHNREKQKRKHTARLRLINKQQNEILSAISHEFKNPMAAIIGYAETLHEDLTLEAKIREKFLSKILSNAHKVTLMLDRLAFSVKLENNDLTLKPTSFDLEGVIQEVVMILQGKYPNRILEYHGQSFMIHADRTMIELVVVNLVDNALKYSEERVRITLTADRLSVQDEGIGISLADQEKITTKFYRVQQNSWDNSMGLGLAIVSYILKRHASMLTIQSRVGVGSTFSFPLEGMKHA